MTMSANSTTSCRATPARMPQRSCSFAAATNRSSVEVSSALIAVSTGGASGGAGSPAWNASFSFEFMGHPLTPLLALVPEHREAENRGAAEEKHARCSEQVRVKPFAVATNGPHEEKDHAAGCREATIFAQADHHQPERQADQSD